MSHLHIGNRIPKIFYNLHRIKLKHLINPVINKGFPYSTCKYNSELEAALNKQIQSELRAAMHYLDMAVYFLHPDVSYVGTGGYFMKMYKEELHHMEVLINYQLIRGGTPMTKIEKNSKEMAKFNLTLMEAFTQALEREKNVTEQLQQVVRTAKAVKDVHCADFITSKFLEEQIKAIHELSQHITVVNRLCGNEHALWDYDKKLLKSYPYSVKILSL